jgi:hypothetical protein
MREGHTERYGARWCHHEQYPTQVPLREGPKLSASCHH